MSRIALAVPGALTTRTGGSFYDRRLVESLRDLGHRVEVVTLPDGFPTPDAPELAHAIRLLAQVPADCPLIVDGLAFGALPTDALAGIAAPLVALVHHPLAHETGLPPDDAARFFHLERANLRLARHVIVPSPHTMRVLRDQYAVPEAAITVLEPGIDRPAWASRAPGVPPLILSVGLLHPRKGHDVLVSALAQVMDLEWQAVIAGTPWDADHVALLHRRVANPALCGRIRLAGAVTEAERDALYGQASLFALATRYEGYGIVFNEALVHGLPILSCRTGAVPDTVPEGAGLLAPPDDPGAFAALLRQALTDRQGLAAMSVAARQAGAALPSWQDVARRAMRVMDGVSGKGDDHDAR